MHSSLQNKYPTKDLLIINSMEVFCMVFVFMLGRLSPQDWICHNI